MTKQQLTTLALFGLAAACGDAGPRSHALPWSEGRVQVIGAEGSVRNVAPSDDAFCRELPGGCETPQRACEGRAADWILDRDGKLVHTLCYPEGGTLSVAELNERDGDVAQNQNNAVIDLDDGLPGVDVAGNLSIDANNVVVYGDDPEHAVIGGELLIDGNNTLVRGVTVQGDVVVAKNNAALAHCVIEGDLIIRGNNTVLAGCVVWGQVRIEANNTKLVGNRLVGGLSATGKNAECTGNYAYVDGDGDGVLRDDELGALLGCD